MDRRAQGTRRPPRKGQFQPGQSGNPRGRPKGAKNLQTYLHEQLASKVTVIEQGKPRKVVKAEAIAMQLVNKASAGDPKGIAAVINLTREYDDALPDGRLDVLGRAEDVAVMEGIIARIRAGSPPQTLGPDACPSDGGALDAVDAGSDDAPADQKGDA